MAKPKQKSIEETYQKLSPREHVLKRPDTYIGSLAPNTVNMYVVEDLKTMSLAKKDITYIPGFLKIFDEIITNASDHAVRTGKVKRIDITITKDTITVENDGPGLPVTIHKEHKIYVPELVFLHLMSGTNFDDTEQRLGGGRNGLGAKLTALYSKEFTIETCDGKKKYTQTAKDNLLTIGKASIKESKKEYTRVTFKPDFERFSGMKEIDPMTMSLIFKRIVDVAAYCAPKTTIRVNDIVIPIKSIKDYMQMHLEPETPLFYEKINDFWEVGFAPSKSGKFEQVSIVNGITTYRGGSHVSYMSKSVSEDLTEAILKGHKKIDLNWTDVKDKLSMFLISKVYNPVFDTQTKENLTSSLGKEFTQGVNLSEKTIKAIAKSEIVQAILDHIELKELQALKKLNKNAKKEKVAKLIEAKGYDRTKCVIGIFEGDSSAASVRKYRDANIFAAYPLRGKFINVSEISPKTILENEEARNLISCIGLSLGESVDVKSLRYGRILIYTDADNDGNDISSLLINFFYTFWPELFEQKRIVKVMTPLLVAKKGKEKKLFYTNEDYQAWVKKEKSGNWDIEYKKGLASLLDDEYETILTDPYMVIINPDKDSKENLKIWFGKKDGAAKKEKILN